MVLARIETPYPIGRGCVESQGKMINHQDARTQRTFSKIIFADCLASWCPCGELFGVLGKGARKRGNPRRFFALLPFFLVILFVFLITPAQTHAQAPIQVGLVVQLAPGNVITQCVSLSQPNPSGWDVLVAANIGVVGSPSSMGMAVCAIGDVGCPASDCWCKFNTGENLYWSYWHSKGSGWVYSNLGASNYIVSPGEVEGWVWGSGGTPPPLYTFDQICAPAATATFTFTPLPTATFTLTPLPSATFTPAPLQTSTFTFTPLPMLTFTAAVPSAGTSLPSPTAAPPTSPPTATQPLQAAPRTPSLTPSPTITLPFGVAIAATTSAPAQNPPQIAQPPSTEMALDLQSISLTATAAEAARQSDPLQGGQQAQAAGDIGFGINALDIAYLTFFAIVAALLLLLIVLVRRRGAL
ncbi:MAG: hypothetical protein ACK44E_06740 [Anaerolineales bacterium]